MLTVEVISHETIKSSSPTPPDLRSMPLSVIDQLCPDMYVQVLLFFRAAGAVPPAALLKSSLAKTLTHFYPLAGRLSSSGPELLRADHAHVDCNDAGVEFYEATVEGGRRLLEAVLGRPPMRELCKLMPDVGANVKPGGPLLAVQLNAFPCGGVALGVCVSHRVADATSLALFLNNWGEMGRVPGMISSPPRYNAASLFPPRDLQWAPVPQTARGSLPERFVIRGPEVGKLRQETAYAGRTQPPTRFEAVATLLWRCIIRARRKVAAAGGGGGDRSSGRRRRRTHVALFPVNLRKRMAGELSDASFGNLVAYALVAADGSAAEDGPGEDLLLQASMEGSMRKAVRSVDVDYVREKLEAFLSPQHGEEEGDVVVDGMQISSWCRISLYRTDFGWGEPAWLCSPMRDLVNVAVLGDTKDGLGVEAWVWLPEPEMEMLVREPELLEFVDPQSISYHTP
ncbi:hypothetical protein Taro_039879 [Colocasia esculenta]|uniref:Uncharacterized protein n=1 Tax=Colocasia esculenta TaxID=4460 RepID=A0A843W7J5_COLES|nr:hypothetical protein [Colocasia esculenta]